MTKPVTYYTTSNSIDTLVDHFGSCLEQLTIDDKKALRLILSQYTYLATPGDDYTLEDAMEDALVGLVVESQDIPEAISILSGITHDDCESLLEAICAQIRYEIAQKRQELRNPKRKWYRVLLEQGVSPSQAYLAAQVLANDEKGIPRTPKDQQ